MKKFKKIAIIILAFSMINISAFAENIDVSLNSVNVNVNGHTISQPNILWNGTTYIPLRAVSETLGMKVDWEDSSRTAYISPMNQSETDAALSQAISDSTYYKNMLYAVDLVRTVESQISDLNLYEFNRIAHYCDLVIGGSPYADDLYNSRDLNGYREAIDTVCNETLVANNSLKQACYYSGHNYNEVVAELKTVYTIVDKMEYAYDCVHNYNLTGNDYYFNAYCKVMDELQPMLNALYQTINSLRKDLF